MIDAAELHAAGILAVDDEQANLDLLGDILRADGFTNIECLSDARLAADRYAATRPALVVLDLAMPHMDGFAVLDQLHAIQQDGHLTVLILTGQADTPTRLRALKSGATDFLTKPFGVPEVLARIRNMLQSHLLMRRVLDHNRQLEHRVKERTLELRHAQREVVHRLAEAAERRDPETGEHIIRMSRSCSLVSAAAGWSAERVDLMLHATPLHDVGKVATPDAILLKPGPLTPDEWVIMRQHTVVGADMLRRGSSPLIRAAREIALRHHERWDGSGYPNGLAGTAIPVTARICAVCDVFDAITNDRCYHRAMGVDSAVQLIREGSGRHFDPEVVRWFERALPEILDVPKRQSD